VESEDGRERSYSLNVEPFQEVHQWLDFYQDFWRGKLDELKKILEED